ncbi:MAG: hypothetical protein CSA35_02450 [Dethiosulfovibrio peptidovorans]|nr:MAG: hypothetical protein CSA35_02450 [Dethiosulfovibrio peptidovorans]
MFRRAVCCLVLTISLLMWGGELWGDEARVLDVLDGDTYRVRCAHGEINVRCLLIDTPELHHPVRGVEELGMEARRAAVAMIASRDVELEIRGIDRYGRTLAHVWFTGPEGPRLLAEELCAMGLALPLPMGDGLEHLDLVERGVSQGRSSRSGLWGIARRRAYTPAQVSSEITALRGHFLSVTGVISRTVVTKAFLTVYLKDSSLRLRLRQPVISSLSPGLFCPGSVVTVTGKVVSGYGGPEMEIGSIKQVEHM